jgi:superfamily II DNA or RNA helicase
MDLQEYELIKDYTSYELDNWSLQKYGPVLYNYQDNRGKRVGLHRHHIGENKIPNLCSAENQQKYPEEQQANRLRYYDLIEHCYRHLLDAEECMANKVSPTGSLLGVGGYYKLRQLLLENPTQETIELVQRFDNRVIQIPIVFEYNQQAFEQALEYLRTKGKALIVIGTGLGKTPSGLEAMRVLIQENISSKTLVLANKNDILDSSWSLYTDFIDVATYQSLITNDHLEEDAKKYDLIICDEAHHMNNNEWSAKVNLLCQYNPNIKLLGLTATPETAQDQNELDLTTCQAFFDGNVCIGMSLLQAIEENIIWPFKYRVGIFEERVLLENLGLTNNDIQKYNLELNSLTWVNQLTQHMPKTPRKGLIFVSKIPDIDSVITSLKSLFPSFDIRPYHSMQNSQEHQNIKNWFDKTDQGFLVSVDQLSEGYHPHGINTLIMLRSTSSSIVYKQQIGRITQLKRFIQDDPDGIVFDFISNYAHLEDAYEFGYKLKDVESVLREKKTISQHDILTDSIELEILQVLEFAYNNTLSKHYWTDKDIQILYKFYENEGPDGVYVRFNKKYSIEAIRSKANELGLYCQYRSVYALEYINNHYVICKEYNKIADAAKDGFNYHAIIQCCQRQMQKSGNYYWCYKEDFSTSWQPIDVSFLRNEPIWIIEDLLRFENFNEASLYYNVPAAYIRKACNQVGGQKAFYINNIAKHVCYYKDKDQFVLPTDEDCSPVVCINTGALFPSIAEASRITGANASSISKCCRTRQGTAKNLDWCYAKDYTPEMQPNKPQSRVIFCIDLQLNFESILLGSTLTDTTRSSLTTAIKNNRPTKSKKYNKKMSWRESTPEDLLNFPLLTKGDTINDQ